jgi:hypothetical protein
MGIEPFGDLPAFFALAAIFKQLFYHGYFHNAIDFRFYYAVPNINKLGKLS